MKNRSITYARQDGLPTSSIACFFKKWGLLILIGILGIVFPASYTWGNTYVVSNTNDSGAGSLRQAILDANGNPGDDVIEFSVAGTLTPLAALPIILDGLIMDGTTAPGYAPGAPVFTISGISLTVSTTSLFVLKGLNFTQPGFQGNYGVNALNCSGTVTVDHCKFSNKSVGIYAQSGTADWTITGNNFNNTGSGANNIALYLKSLTGAVSASGNLFGGPGASNVLTMENMHNLVIGDASVANADIIMEDNSGANNLGSGGNSMTLYSCSNITLDNIDLTKISYEYGNCLVTNNCTGNMIVKNCKLTKASSAIWASNGPASWTMTDNNLQDNGWAFQFNAVAGSISASGNQFGGDKAGGLMLLSNMNNIVIGDENVSGANFVIEDNSGADNLGFGGTAIQLTTCSNITVDNVNVDKPGAQVGTGIYALSCTGAMTINNCSFRNHQIGIKIIYEAANWTITGNNLQKCGPNSVTPAMYLQSLTGVLNASGNLFGGAGAGTAIQLAYLNNRSIGNQDVPGATIKIEDNSGANNLTAGGIGIYVTSCSNISIDHVDLTKPGTLDGEGIRFEACTGSMSISNCTLKNRNYGVNISSVPNTLSLTCSAFSNNSVGVIFSGSIPANLTFNNNNFSGNTRGVSNLTGTQIIAENNFWNSCSAPAQNTFNGYAGNVDVLPYLGSPAACAPPVVLSSDFLSWYADADSDGYGNAGISLFSCTQPSGYVSDNTDCDDSDAAVHPGAVEICNGIDDDCDGLTDDDDPGITGQDTWYADADNDGYGNPDVSTLACVQPEGYVSDNTDCNDGDPTVNPIATEVCNGIDDDCDGLTDDDDPDIMGQITWYIDADEDGYGNPAVSEVSCNQPQGYVANNNDCNDANANIHPGVTETCNGIDDDCDGLTDEGCNNPLTVDAGTCQVVYYGYTPMSCTTLNAVASGGTPPYAFSWSNGMSGATIEVCPTTGQTYMVTVTSSDGATASDGVNVEVVDVRCGNNNNKVLLCHNGSNTLCVSSSAVPDHLSHGDYLGTCGTAPCSGNNEGPAGENRTVKVPDTAQAGELAAYPNPFGQTVLFDFFLAEGQPVVLGIYDMQLRIVKRLMDGYLDEGMHTYEWQSDGQPAGIYFARLQAGNQIRTIRLVKIN